jgi:hypothetical protein
LYFTVSNFGITENQIPKQGGFSCVGVDGFIDVAVEAA